MERIRDHADLQMRVPSRPRTPDRRADPGVPHAPPPFTSTPDRPEPLSLDGSWIPIGSIGDTDNVTGSTIETDSELHDDDDMDDDDSSLDLDSSVDLGSIDGSTTGSHSPFDDMDVGVDTPDSLASSRIAGDYVDAEAPSTRLHDSTSQIELVYPYPLEDSFASSLTGSDTTPTASVGSLHPSIVGQRSSRYRLETRREPFLAIASSLSSSSELASRPIAHDDHPLSTFNTGPKDPSAWEAFEQGQGEEDKVRPEEDKVDAPSNERLLRVAKHIRQRWSLRTSLVALTSLVSIAIATVQYAPLTSSSTSSEAARIPIMQTPKPFSILDYLPIQIHSLADPVVTIPNSQASSYMPDVRLIRNALSLSTKSNAVAPAKLPKTANGVKAQSTHTYIAKSVGPTSHSLSLRNTDVALTTIIDASTKWHKSLRGLGRTVGTKRDGAAINDRGMRNATGHDQVTRAQLKSATFDAISEGRVFDVFYFVHLQLCAMLRSEVGEAIALGQYVMDWGKNTTRSAGNQAMAGASYLRQHLTTGLYSLAEHAHSVRVVKAEEARVVSNKARAGLDAVTERASLTSQWGKEYIHQARAGLDYLIAEGKRRQSHFSPAHREEVKKQVPIPLKGKGKGKRDGRSGCGKSRSRWSRHQASCGGVAITPPAERVKGKGDQMTWSQKAFRAIHDAAPALIF